MECEDRELSLLFTDDDEIAELNAHYRAKPKPTDVLSFPLGSASTHLGDVVISVPTMRRQAKAFGVRPREELLRLLIHGMLHLVGYDHEGVPPAEARRMRSKEKQLFEQLRGALEPTRKRK